MSPASEQVLSTNSGAGTRSQVAARERWLLAEELLSQLRHPLRNKLSSIRNAAYYIRRSLEKSGMPADPRVGTFLTLIADELSAAEQHLALGAGPTERSSGPILPVRLSECAQTALQQYAVPAEIAVTVQCEQDPALYLPAPDLVVALGCLLDNACESIAGAGCIRLSTSASQDWVTFSVADSGTGFTPESAKRAFEAFYSTKPLHLGLGLNLVQRVVKGHGGEVLLEGEPASACVTLRFPKTLTDGGAVSSILEQA